MKALRDENPYVAYNITRAIMKFPKTQVVEAVSCALEITDRNTRRRAAKLLGEMRHKKSVSRLSALLGDADPAVRYEAVEALRKIGDIKVLGKLISCLGDESVDVRYGAIQALRALGDERAIEPLVRICPVSYTHLDVYKRQAYAERDSESQAAFDAGTCPDSCSQRH